MIPGTPVNSPFQQLCGEDLSAYRGLQNMQQPEPCRELAVPAALGCLAHQVDRANKICNEIEKRLDPVMRCEPPKPCDPKECPTAPGLAARIAELYKRLGLISDRYESMLARLEI